jgi:hypothetical protein
MFVTAQSDGKTMFDIDTMTEHHVGRMEFWKNLWKGEIRKTSHGEYMMGTYWYNEKSHTVNITELPYQTWNTSYCEKILLKPHVRDVSDSKSTKLQTNITITLKDDAIEKLSKLSSKRPEFDVIEEYLGLHTKMNHFLNMMKDDSAISYTSYEQVFAEWFKMRADLYIKRIEWLTTLLKIKIMFAEQVTKFVDNHNKYDFSKLDENVAIEMLAADGYIKFNSILLASPGITPAREMNQKMYGANGNYNYLFAIGPRQRMESARVTRAKKLAKYREDLKNLSTPNIIADTWLDELTAVDAVIKKGTSTEAGWLYGESKAKFEKISKDSAKETKRQTKRKKKR